MNPAQVLQHGLAEVSNAEANGPVCVSLKFDYLIGTKEILKQLHQDVFKTLSER